VPTSKRSRFDSSHEISTRAAANILGAPSGVQAIVLTGSHKGTSKVVGGRLRLGAGPADGLLALCAQSNAVATTNTAAAMSTIHRRRRPRAAF